MLFNLFVFTAVMKVMSDINRSMLLRSFVVEDEEEVVEIPKGYYKCIDCGKICERVNASQKRCKECQKKHKRELNREYDKKRKK